MGMLFAQHLLSLYGKPPPPPGSEILHKALGSLSQHRGERMTQWPTRRSTCSVRVPPSVFSRVTPLHRATNKGILELVELLLDSNANINAQDKNGVLCHAVPCCAVLWCGVPKALLPKGKGRDVYPRVQVNGRAVCVVRALCASVFRKGRRAGRGRPGGSPPGHRSWPRGSCGTPSLSACWCRRSSCNTHAIELFGPNRASSSVASLNSWPRCMSALGPH